MRLRRRAKDFDEGVFDSMATAMQAGIEHGLSPEQATQVASQALQTALDESAPRVVQTLVRWSPRMLRWYRRQQRGFDRRLRKHWGKALDLYRMIVVCAEDAGREFDEVRRAAAVEQQDLIFEALTGLHARACRVALEVGHLLSGGFPLGALARNRTLHELAVTAMILADYGRRDEHPDLAERFILHEVVMSYADAVIFQANCEALGAEPLSDEDIAAMKKNHDTLIERYGPTYARQYGWAVGLDGPNPTFRDLERFASVSHMRGHYRWASHEVHADAKGWAANRRERGDVRYMMTGPMNFDLAEPAQMALISLYQSTVSLLLSVEDVSPRDLLALMAMERLVDDAVEVFGQGEDSVSRAEERFQAQQKTQRRRLLPFW
jgi:hypothetical protein